MAAAKKNASKSKKSATPGTRGRKPKLNGTQAKSLRSRLKKGATLAEVAKEFGVSIPTVVRYRDEPTA